jgi:FtsH-binding integral membrane protein
MDDSRAVYAPSAERTAERVSAFLTKVYGWMCIGLGITAAVAYFASSSAMLIGALTSNRLVFFGLVVIELGLVFFLSARVQSLEPSTAAGLFVVYAALNGVTLSVILLVYTGASIATTFVVTGAMFGALAVFGTTT